MKYRELPNEQTLARLTAYAFVREGADRSVFAFYKAIAPSIEYFNNQRTKLFQKFGTASEAQPDKLTIPEQNKQTFLAEMNKLLDEETLAEIPSVDLNEDDFIEPNCRKPSDAQLLLSTNEKMAILKIATSR